MARLVLSDASPLIGLARVDGVSWLRDLFGVVVLTSDVEKELRGRGDLEPAIDKAINDGWLRRLGDSFHDKEAAPSADILIQPPHLGDGEWSTIVAAMNHKGPNLLLLDDRLARREAAAQGFQIAGTAAVIVLASRRNLVDSPRSVFERLLQSGFRMSPRVVREALAAVNCCREQK